MRRLIEPPHLDLCCLQKPIIIICGSERVNATSLYSIKSSWELITSTMIRPGPDTHSKKPASVAQLDAPSNWRPGGRGFKPRRGRQHSFMEIDHEIFSTVILSLPLIQEGRLSVSGERICTILVNRLENYACPVNVWLGKLTALDMTPLG